MSAREKQLRELEQKHRKAGTPTGFPSEMGAEKWAQCLASKMFADELAAILSQPDVARSASAEVAESSGSIAKRERYIALRGIRMGILQTITNGSEWGRLQAETIEGELSQMADAAPKSQPEPESSGSIAQLQAKLDVLREFKDKHDLGWRPPLGEMAGYHDYADVGSNHSEKILDGMIYAIKMQLAHEAEAAPKSQPEPPLLQGMIHSTDMCVCGHVIHHHGVYASPVCRDCSCREFKLAQPEPQEWKCKSGCPYPQRGDCSRHNGDYCMCSCHANQIDNYPKFEKDAPIKPWASQGLPKGHPGKA